MSGYANLISSYTPAMWWKCDEASGTALTDSSGNSRTGTITGSVKYGLSGGSGDGSKGITLDGLTAYFRANSYSPFQPNAKLTVVVLLRPEQAQDIDNNIKNIFGGSGTLVPGVSDDMKFPVLETGPHTTFPVDGAYHNNVRWYSNISSQFPLSTDWTDIRFPQGKWIHIVFTMDDTLSGLNKLGLWVNGANYGIPTGPWAPAASLPVESAQFMVGVRFGVAGGFQQEEFHYATYSNVAVFTRILTNAEITALFAERFAQTVTLTPTVRSALTGAGRGQ